MDGRLLPNVSKGWNDPYRGESSAKSDNNFIPNFSFRGIQRIEIPKTDDDFRSDDYGRAVIRKYLPYILKAHKENAEKIDFCYNYYLGVQDILEKQRLYQKDSINNNKIVENHAHRQAAFKVGYITSEKRDYTHKADSDTDDLTYLDHYFTDCHFFQKDIELKEWVFATGIGATYTAPRTDIILPNGVDSLTGSELTRYATKEDGFNIDYEAPFEYYVINPTENFVVYSSRYDKKPLFCVSVVTVDVSNNSEEPEYLNEIHVETRYASFVWESDSRFLDFNDRLELTKIKTLHYLPIIEYATNRARMGLVELNRDMFNLINTLNSATADMIVDNANVILVFKNTDITGDQVKDMKAAGAIIISDSQNSRQNSQASLDTIKLEIPFDGLNEYYEEKVTQAYDIAGVPLASGNVTSGGDTGQARILGGGWQNAYTMIRPEIETLLTSDYEELKLILYLCKQVPNCPLNELYASQIDIKYRINQSDNYLVKTQGMMNLYNIGLPTDEILKTSGLFSDIPTVDKKWRDRIAELKAEKAETEGKATETIDVETNSVPTA